MPSFSLSWSAVAGAEGYNVHSGQITTIYTDNTDVGNVLSATVTVPWSGAGFAAVAGYDTVDGDVIEGPYSTEVPITTDDSTPPTGVPVLSAR